MQEKTNQTEQAEQDTAQNTAQNTAQGTVDGHLIEAQFALDTENGHTPVKGHISWLLESERTAHLSPEQLEELVQSLPRRFGDAIAEVLEQIEHELVEGQQA